MMRYKILNQLRPSRQVVAECIHNRLRTPRAPAAMIQQKRAASCSLRDGMPLEDDKRSQDHPPREQRLAGWEDGSAEAKGSSPLRDSNTTTEGKRVEPQTFGVIPDQPGPDGGYTDDDISLEGYKHLESLAHEERWERARAANWPGSKALYYEMAGWDDGPEGAEESRSTTTEGKGAEPHHGWYEPDNPRNDWRYISLGDYNDDEISLEGNKLEHLDNSLREERWERARAANWPGSKALYYEMAGWDDGLVGAEESNQPPDSSPTAEGKLVEQRPDWESLSHEEHWERAKAVGWPAESKAMYYKLAGWDDGPELEQESNPLPDIGTIVEGWRVEPYPGEVIPDAPRPVGDRCDDFSLENYKLLHSFSHEEHWERAKAVGWPADYKALYYELSGWEPPEDDADAAEEGTHLPDIGTAGREEV